jgi:di/tricarboxylate transporter
LGWEAWFTLAVVVVVLFALARNIAPDAVLVGGVVIVMLAGIISPEEAFSGFSNAGMLTVAALYVVAAGLRETGALDTVGAWMLGRAKTERQGFVRLAVFVPVISAFLNNTPIVAMFIPVITGWCKKTRVSPSRLLMPLSFLSILGGTCTLIGTSTNLVVNGLMADAVKANPALSDSLRPMALFELGKVGLPYAVIGILYLYFVGMRLLPARKNLLEQLTGAAREYLVNVQVESGCKLVGKDIAAAGLRHLPGLFLIEIARENQVIAPVPPDQVLMAGDVLTFTGVVSTIVDLEKIPGLVPTADAHYEGRPVRQRDRVLCEAVVSGSCRVLGRSIRDANFRALYNAAVVAVHRGSERLEGKVGDMVLRPGDTLLLQTGPHFRQAHRNNSDFLLVSSIEDSRPFRNDKALFTLVLLAGLIALMATEVIPVVMAAFLVAGLMVLSRCISIVEARRSVDIQTLVTIAAAFGLGKALVNSGAVGASVGLVVDNIGVLGPVAMIAGVYMVTTFFTEIVTNNAAAALVFPFAVGIAQTMGLDPRPFVMTVTFAASASFITPLGYQTNLMVYGPGGYRFTDFIRVGLPLNLLLLATGTLLIPFAWPF